MSRPLVTIQGFAELQKKIEALATDKEKKAEILKILRRVANGTVRVARQNAPQSKKPHLISGQRTRRLIQPGNLAKSIGIITGRRGQAKDNPTIYVGPRAKGNNLGFYGNFVEYGHNVYNRGFKRRRSASNAAKSHNATGARGRTRAVPFMRQTYNQTGGQVTAESEKAVAKYIQKRIDHYSTKR